MIVKVCGVTREADLEVCAIHGVDWVGLNLWRGSKRHVALEQAIGLAERARSLGLETVALLVEAGPDVLRGVWERGAFDRLQIYAPAGPVPAGIEWIRPVAVAAGEVPDLEGSTTASHDLVETAVAGYGGAGQRFEWEVLRDVPFPRPALVAGGIRPDNVEELLRLHRPFGIDLASGVEERPGVKDAERIRTLMEKVRGFEPDVEHPA